MIVHLLLVAALYPPTAQEGEFALSYGSVSLSGDNPPLVWEYNKLKGTFQMAFVGKPARAKVNNLGLSIAAKRLSVAGRTTDGKNFYVTDAHARTTAVIVFDSAVASKYGAKTSAASTNKAADYRIEVDGEQTDYGGSATSGRLDIPKPFDLSGKMNGRQVVKGKKADLHQSYKQTFRMHAGSGYLDVDPRPGLGIDALKNGEFFGPISFSGEREETIEEDNSFAKYTLENGRCNHMKITTDAEGEFLTLEGNVGFDITQDGQTTHISKASSATFRFDKSMAIVSFQLLGAEQPFEMTLPVEEKKG